MLVSSLMLMAKSCGLVLRHGTGDVPVSVPVCDIGDEWTGELEALVLVASGQGATLCCNCNGVSRSIRKIASGCLHDPDAEAAAEWIGENYSARRKFAHELIAMLECAARCHRYDCVIILADNSILEELRRSAPAMQSPLLIAGFLEPVAGPPSHNEDRHEYDSQCR